MADQRETAQRKMKGKDLPQAPSQKPNGRRQRPGHVACVDGNSTTLSHKAVLQMPKQRARAIFGGK